MTEALIIQEKERCCIEDYQIEVLSYLGVLTPNVHYFKVIVLPSGQMAEVSDTDSDTISGGGGDRPLENNTLGLLRVGSLDSGLSRELQLREILKDYGLIAQLLAYIQVPSAIINPTPSIAPPETETEEIPLAVRETDREVAEASTSEYLEEEYYPEKPLSTDTSPEKLCLLSEFPSEHLTVETWLKTSHSYEESLSLVIHICQCFSYVSQQQWCIVNLLPQLIEIGKPLKLFDLTSAYANGENPPFGLSGDYYAPELATGHSINELMSSYTVGALLYQLIHQKLPQPNQIDLNIHPIPRIYQLLKICLSPISEERFPLLQLRSLLLETRHSFRTPKIHWNIASHSTIGLSTERLHNEDNYGVRQQQLSNSETLLIGVVADGMGGMAQGEIASQIAVKTVLEEPIPTNFKSPEHRNHWLIELFQKANQAIATTVKNGGTTLSVIFALNDNLMIAHVGDSRIYLLRQNQIQQLSQDHSLVAMLVANGEITPEESLTHPDRNVLLRSLGSTYLLSNDYVQTFNETKEQLFMTLENKDIILLCSDGVWDLVAAPEIVEIFSNFDTLQYAVDTILKKVMAKGASDNATLLALQCTIGITN